MHMFNSHSLPAQLPPYRKLEVSLHSANLECSHWERSCMIQRKARSLFLTGRAIASLPKGWHPVREP